MEKIRMAALDFDLTLVDYPPQGGYELDPEARRLFGEMIANGAWVGLVSGRDVWPMKDILTVAGVEWGMPFPNYYIRRENYLHYQADGVWTEDVQWNAAVREKTMDFCAKYAGEVPGWLEATERAGFRSHNWILFSDFGLEAHYPSEETAAGAQKVLQELLGQRRDVQLHRNRMMLNVVPAGTGKGAALLHASKFFGLKPEQVIAFGDSDNDVSMLDGRYGFRSGTVSKSSRQVQKAVLANGGYLATQRASHGVCHVLKRLAGEGCVEGITQ